MDVVGLALAVGSFGLFFGVGWWFLNRSLYNHLEERDPKVQVRTFATSDEFVVACSPSAAVANPSSSRTQLPSKSLDPPPPFTPPPANAAPGAHG